MFGARVVAGACLILLGIGWLLQESGIVHFPPDIIAPIALIAIGVALTIGARRGLHTGLLIAGIVLSIILTSNNGDHPRHGPTVIGYDARGSARLETPISATELRPYDLGAGNLTIDLTHLPLNGETYNVSAHVGTGRLQVIVPSGTTVRANAHVGVGKIDIFGQHTGGAGSSDVVDINYDGRTTFVLRLRVGAGNIGVKHRVPANA